MKILVLLTFVGIALCDFPLRSDWREIPPASEAPELKALALKMFGRTKIPKTGSPGRIVNGHLAQPGQFPYQALTFMQRADGAWFWCGSVIIDSHWFLTAAHCLFDRIQAEIYAGMIDRQASSPYWSGMIPSANFRIHPGYSAALLDNDIALIQVNSPISFSPLVNVIQLPLRAHSTVDIAGMAATASGFGAMQAGGPGSQFLRWWTQPVAANGVCLSWYAPGWFRSEQNICIDPSVTRMSACQGDSGGPLTISLNGHRVFGVFSFTPGIGCDLGFPEAWVRVTFYLDWIHSHTGLVP